MFILFLRRSFAYLTDSMLVLIFIRPAAWAEHAFGDLDALTYVALQFFATAITTAYIVGFHARWGCTLGKRFFGLRVTAVDGTIPPPLRNAFLRWLPILILGHLLPVVGAFALPNWSEDIYSRGRWHANAWQTVAALWLMADFVAALLTRGRRSLHDMLAGTTVTEKPN